MDLTMISTAELNSVSLFSISCINGDRNAAHAELDIKRDNKILIFPKKPAFTVHNTRNKAVAKDFRELDNIGIFYCETSQDVAPHEKVTMINNVGTGAFRDSEYKPALKSVMTLHPKFNQIIFDIQFPYAFNLNPVFIQ